jgi:hypothetical protein
MWKDAEGKIVTKKPTLPNDIPKPQQLLHPHHHDLLSTSIDFLPFPSHQEGAPISPPISNNSQNHSWDDHDSGLGTVYPSNTLDPNALSSSGSYSPVDQRFWSTDLPQPQPGPVIATVFDDAPFDDIFNPDTASSFNNPFTTMSNYNWLFDMDLSKVDEIQQPIVHETFPTFAFDNNGVSHPSHAFDLQLDHMMVDKPTSTSGQLGSLASQHTSSPQHHSPSAALITPPSRDEPQKPVGDHAVQLPELDTIDSQISPRVQVSLAQDGLGDIERPMSMLQPSRSLPIIDELARAQVLDVIDITQPTAPDGSIVMRGHPLLTLSCLQTYCDLFFTRFNTAYPLIHMSTFDPSDVDTLLLISVLLLGATYGEKDAHQLAVSSRSMVKVQY